MAEQLQGNEFRVFRSLATEWHEDTVEKICLELTRGPEVGAGEVEKALGRLREGGWIEELQPSHWKLTPNGHGCKKSLLGKS